MPATELAITISDSSVSSLSIKIKPNDGALVDDLANQIYEMLNNLLGSPTYGEYQYSYNVIWESSFKGETYSINAVFNEIENNFYLNYSRE